MARTGGDSMVRVGRRARPPVDTRAGQLRIDVAPLPDDTRRSRVSPFSDSKADREPEATAAASSAMTHRARRTWGLAALAVVIVSIGVLHPAAVAAQTPGGPVA